MNERVTNMKAPIDEHEWVDYRGESHKDKWLDYQGKAYIFENPLGNWEENNMVSFQFNGTMCYEANINNNVVDSFKRDFKWFDRDMWYKKTSWGHNYPEEIYFEWEEVDINLNDIQDEDIKNIHDKASFYAIPSIRILDSIIAHIQLFTNKKYEFPFDNTDYGEHWWEAYVPLELNNKRYLLTWQNCD